MCYSRYRILKTSLTGVLICQRPSSHPILFAPLLISFLLLRAQSITQTNFWVSNQTCGARLDHKAQRILAILVCPRDNSFVHFTASSRRAVSVRRVYLCTGYAAASTCVQVDCYNTVPCCTGLYSLPRQRHLNRLKFESHPSNRLNSSFTTISRFTFAVSTVKEGHSDRIAINHGACHVQQHD